MRFFIDSNVLVSAAVFDRNELKVLLECMEKGHQLVISDHIVEEIFRTMLDKFPEHVNLFNEFIRLGSFEVTSKEIYIDKIESIDLVRDKHDRHVLASAFESKCDYIVTGDKDLLVLESYKEIKIETTRAVLRTI